MKLLALAALLAAGLALGQTAASGIPKIKFTDTRLDNGLRVIISEDHFAPVYAICVDYKVGSKDERKGRTGFDLTLANRAIERTNPDYIACMVMNQVLGSGPAARLFRIIREEKGYTYGVSSSFSASKVMQHFSAALSVRTEVTEAALTDMLKEFRDIRDVPVPQLELDGAKRTLVARFALDLESPAGVLSRWMQQREYGQPEDYWDTYTTKIMAVTAADVARVAKKYVPYDNVQIVAVGDGAKIRDLLKKFGPVEESSAASGN
jgi:predicted Zn-dependent peptidase